MSVLSYLTMKMENLLQVFIFAIGSSIRDLSSEKIHFGIEYSRSEQYGSNKKCTRNTLHREYTF